MKKNPPVETIAAIVVGLVLVYWFFHIEWLIPVAGVVGLLGLLSNRFAGWVHLLWGYLTRALGFVSSHLLLSVVFFVVLSPLALLYRLVKGAKESIKRNRDSMFVERNHQYEAKDLKNPW